MRRTRSTRRRVRAASGSGLSMFPFLAVLICTIGSLVVLLVVITRQARMQAAAAAAEAAAEVQQNAEEKLEMAQWRIEQLQDAHAKTLGQVADLRNTLGHLEDHARTLKTQLRELEGIGEALAEGHDPSRRAAVEAELRQTIAEIAAAERALTDAQREAAGQAPSFAVIPYQGPNETRRRPIYIECRGDAVVLQPEGITFRADDFDGPDGPGNPLAAAIRAKREYLLEYGNLDPRQAGEPYPLLIVRPNGIAAYYAARNAMTSWGSEFGYELVESDWQIEFPQPDPQLAELLRRTVEAARIRQEQLAAAAPRHYGSQRSQVMYRAAPGGGITVDGARPEPVRPGTRYGSGAGGTPGGEKPGRAFGTSGDERPGPADSAQDGAMPEGGSGFSGTPGGQRPSGSAAERPGGPAQGEAGGENASGSSQPASDGGGASRSGSGQPASDGEGTPLKLGEWRDPDTLRPLADRKGRDWALPNANQRATPITRPVRIECHPDRLLLPSRSGESGSRTVWLGAGTAESVDELVAAVWDVIDGWGIAGRDLYWSPVLEVRVAAGAESRFNDLEVLLRGSGFTLERL